MYFYVFFFVTKQIKTKQKKHKRRKGEKQTTLKGRKFE